MYGSKLEFASNHSLKDDQVRKKVRVPRGNQIETILKPRVNLQLVFGWFMTIEITRVLKIS